MKVIVQNLAVSYSDEGAGPVVVLLHGWGVDAQNLASIKQALTDRYRVISIDLPGFGASEIPKTAWRVRDYARFVADLLVKLGVQELHALVGHSFGGRITLLGVGEAILRPQQVVLIGSAGIKHSDDIRNTIYRFVAKSGKMFFSLPGLRRFSGIARNRLYHTAGSTDYINAGPMKAIFAHTIAEDLSEQASRITCPALLIWGEYDQEAPVSDGERLHQLIKDSTLHILSGAGHFVHADASAATNKLIREFLS